MATEEGNGHPSLPPYPQMIMAALEALKEKDGSNKTTIAKYIESNYGNLPPAHSTLLSHHLNRMKSSGELIFSKNNYMKPDPNGPPRRGRGRPPKPKAPLPAGAAEAAAVTGGPVRPRGRPRKDSDAPPPPKKVPSAPAPAPDHPDDGNSGGISKTGRPRGRPPKVRPSAAEVGVQGS